jgi:phospholipase/carboxylesterase
MVIPAWHDVFAMGSRELPANGWPGMRESVRYIRRLIFDEVDSGAEKIILGGFSQGAATALATAFHTDLELAGVVALSGFYPNPNKDNAKLEIRASANVRTPVFVGHGTHDPIILYEAADSTNAALSEEKVPVTFKTYEGMQHTVSVAEINDVCAFLQTILH